MQLRRGHGEWFTSGIVKMTYVASGSCARKVVAAAAFAAVVGASSMASAVNFSGSYQVNALSSDPGLVIQTAELADPLNFALNNPGDMFMIDLFDIWTDESSANLDDFASANISVDFNFVAPPSLGSVNGTTMAGTIFIASSGVLEWDGPSVLDFGTGGQLQISLSDELFNVGGGLGLTPGRDHGATVQATFKLISDSTTVVPLPASLPLFMAALSGLALLRRRTRAAA